jgi:cyclic pyranopterin phosphate synthase
MPEEGIQLSPKSHLMTYEEIYDIARIFVEHGVNKIRLTGGEPLIRKDFTRILEKLASLGVSLSITTNGVIVDRFIEDLKINGVKGINLSLDSLDPERFKLITRRDQFDQVYKNMLLLIREGFKVKLNAVLMKGVNDDEITDFIKLGKTLPISVRFIEFMPFDGNRWNLEKTVPYAEVMRRVHEHFSNEQIERLEDAPNDTSKNYRIKGYKGTFAVISSVTNPFCDSCNRIRLTANGRIKNCLFSASETDLLTPFREGKSIEPLIAKALDDKFKVRGGMDTMEKLENPELHGKNRSMISIGG